MLRAEVSEAGIDEIVFDLSRINMDVQLFEKVPGDGQKRLNNRVSIPKYTRIHFSNKSNLPKWNTHTKAITKTEKMNAQLSPVGIDRVQYRVVTPDSVLLARSKQKVLALNGDFLMRKGAINNTDFVQKRLKPIERLPRSEFDTRISTSHWNLHFIMGMTNTSSEICLILHSQQSSF